MAEHQVRLEDILRMAREAGFMLVSDDWYECFSEEIERFFLVASTYGATTERESCAQLCEKSDRYRGDYFAALIRERK